MTVDVEVGHIVYQGDGIVSEFPFRFTVFAPTDVKVLLSDAQDVLHELVYQQNFTVALHSLPLLGGVVRLLTTVNVGNVPNVLGSPLAKGAQLIVMRAVASVQDTLYPEHSPIFQRQIEMSFDKTTVLIQQVEEELTRTLRVPILSDESPEEFVESLFDARDEAKDFANQAAEVEQRVLVIEAATIAERERAEAAAASAENSATDAEAARDAAILQNTVTDAIIAAELENIEEIISEGQIEQQLAINKAKKWSSHPVDMLVENDAEGNPLYSAKHHAAKAQMIGIPQATRDSIGGIIVSTGLAIEGRGELSIDAGAGLGFDDTGKLMVTLDSFPTGTCMVFMQAAAPTGWIKLTDSKFENAALRFTTGEGGGDAGGSVTFDNAFRSQSVSVSGRTGSTTLSSYSMPSHKHNLWGMSGGGTVNKTYTMYVNNSFYARSGKGANMYQTMDNTGSSGSHNHSMSGSASVNLSVKRVNAIVARKA